MLAAGFGRATRGDEDLVAGSAAAFAAGGLAREGRALFVGLVPFPAIVGDSFQMKKNPAIRDDRVGAYANPMLASVAISV